MMMMMMQVMMAVGVCAAITLGLTVFAFQTKIDFTAMGGETQHSICQTIQTCQTIHI